MKPTIVITNTEESTTEKRAEQSAYAIEQEKLTPLTIGKHVSKVFKKGQKLTPERCLLDKPIDGWTSVGNHLKIKDLLTAKEAKRLEREFSAEGLAGFIATTDTTAGVREVIEYDENEQIVKPLIEEPKDDQ